MIKMFINAVVFPNIAIGLQILEAKLPDFHSTVLPSSMILSFCIILHVPLFKTVISLTRVKILMQFISLSGYSGCNGKDWM